MMHEGILYTTIPLPSKPKAIERRLIQEPGSKYSTDFQTRKLPITMILRDHIFDLRGGRTRQTLVRLFLAAMFHTLSGISDSSGALRRSSASQETGGSPERRPRRRRAGRSHGDFPYGQMHGSLREKTLDERVNFIRGEWFY